MGCKQSAVVLELCLWGAGPWKGTCLHLRGPQQGRVAVVVREGWDRAGDQAFLQPVCLVVVGGVAVGKLEVDLGTERKGRKMGGTLKRSWDSR